MVIQFCFRCSSWVRVRVRTRRPSGKGLRYPGIKKSFGCKRSYNDFDSDAIFPLINDALRNTPTLTEIFVLYFFYPAMMILPLLKPDLDPCQTVYHLVRGREEREGQKKQKCSPETKYSDELSMKLLDQRELTLIQLYFWSDRKLSFQFFEIRDRKSPTSNIATFWFADRLARG